MRSRQAYSTLRYELEHRIRSGRCAYCRLPATPDQPLTREHVIPRSKGGRRKDARIIVPACAECNQRRGSQEIVVFLLARPTRIAAFIEYLNSLPVEALQEVDLRVFAELYAAVWFLEESIAPGDERAASALQLARQRRLHRRRYAARRIVHAIGRRVERVRERATAPEGPSCLVPALHPEEALLAREGAEDGAGELPEVHVAATLLTALSLLWGVPADRVLRELVRERQEMAARAGRGRDVPDVDPDDAPERPPRQTCWRWDLDARTQRGGKRRRMRFDRRQGRHPVCAR